MSLRASPPLVAIVLVTKLMLVSTAIRAQTSSPENIEKGKALFAEADAAMDRKDYAVACPKLEEVIRLVPEGVGAKLTLAECYESDGRLASAWKSFKVAEAAAAAMGQPQREKEARERAQALEPRLSTLTISVSEAVRALSGLEVRRDGEIVEPSLWGMKVPVDGGTHQVTATATNKQAWKTTVEIAASGEQGAVDLSALLDVKPPSVKVLPAPQPLPAAASGSFWNAQRTAGLVTGSAGLAAVGVGAAFGFISLAKRDKSNADGHCSTDNLCDATGVALRDEALTAGTVSTVMFIAGGALVTAGAVVFGTAPKAPTSVRTEVALGPRGLALHGRW